VNINNALTPSRVEWKQLNESGQGNPVYALIAQPRIEAFATSSMASSGELANKEWQMVCLGNSYRGTLGI
jgi:hypothetical protein